MADDSAVLVCTVGGSHQPVLTALKARRWARVLFVCSADLPPEIYAYRAGRNAQQAVVEVEELLFRGHPDVVDADLADYLEAASYCPPAYEVTSNSVGCAGIALILKPFFFPRMTRMASSSPRLMLAPLECSDGTSPR